MRANPERLHSGALLGGGSISQGLWRKQLSLGLACFRRVIETMTATCSPNAIVVVVGRLVTRHNAPEDPPTLDPGLRAPVTK